MTNPFDRLECNRYRIIRGTVSRRTNGFTLPVQDPFDTQAYSAAVDRAIDNIKQDALRKLNVYYRWPHCRDQECPHKTFLYAFEDSPIKVNYHGIIEINNADFHSWFVDYSRSFTIYIECQSEFIGESRDVAGLEVDWETLQELIAHASGLTDFLPG